MNSSIKELCLGLAILSLSLSSFAANFVIINTDGENEGLNDIRPVDPINGNSFSTLGEQRAAVITAALDYIGSSLQTDLEFSVRVQFDALFCDAETALLGGGAPVDTFVDFDGAPKYQTQYPAALANLHAGYDLDPASPELELIFNSDIDFNDDCLAGTSLYYGLDGEEPEGTVNFYSIVLHEIVHAIGFLTFMDYEGETPYSYSDPFMEAMFSPVLGQHLDETGIAYASVYNHLPLVFFGEETRFRSGALTQGAELLATAINGERIFAPYMYTPESYSAGSSFSHWDISLLPVPLMAPFTAEPIITLSEFELAALGDIGWPVLLPLQDRDGDGIPDRDDGSPDDSSKSDWSAEDANRNNLPDAWEAQYGLEFQADNVYLDRDSDGVSNIREYAEGTNPLLPDTDGDGLGDWAELLFGFDPLSPDSCPTADCTNNFDGSVPSLHFDLDYYIHEDISPTRTASSTQVVSIKASADGGVFISGYSDASGGWASQVDGRLIKLNAAGQRDNNFGRVGEITTKDVGALYGNAGAIVPAEDSQGRLYHFNPRGFSGRTRPKNAEQNTYHLVWEYSIHRVLASGKQDATFTPIQIESAGINPTMLFLAVDNQDRLVVAFETSRASTEILDLEVKRYLPSGEADESFGDNGTFHFQGTQSLVVGGVYINASDDLFFPVYYFGLPQGSSILKISSLGLVAAEFGDGNLSGFLKIDQFHSLSFTDNDFLLFETIDDPAKHGHDQLIRIRKYDNNGNQLSEYFIDSLPTNVFNPLSCDRSLLHWVCVVDSSRGYASDQNFLRSHYYAQVFDLNFNALGSPKALEKIKLAGETIDSEELVGITHTANNDFIVISQINGTSGVSSNKLGVRHFSSMNGWDSEFGENGLEKTTFKGAAEILTSFKVDENQHAIIGFLQQQNKINSNVTWQAGLLHFFPNGERNSSFGTDGFISIPSSSEGTTQVIDTVFDSHKNLIVLAVTKFRYGTPGDQLKIFRFDRVGDAGYTYSTSSKLIYDVQLGDMRQFFSPQLLVLPNDELLLKSVRGIYYSYSQVYSELSVNLHHMDNEGRPLTSIWESGHYAVANYPDLQSYTLPNIHSLHLNENKELVFYSVRPPELGDRGTLVQSISLTPEADNKGIANTLFKVDPYIFVDGFLPLFEQDRFFVYGSTCLVAFKCEQSHFGYYAVVDANGDVDAGFNGGQPALIFQGRREDVAARHAYRIGNEILVTATMDIGFYARLGSGDYPSDTRNAGNAFYAIAFDMSGRVLGSDGAFVAKTPGFEIYGHCHSQSNYSGACGVFNDHHMDVRALSWKDPSRLVDPFTDSDGDGIPDHIENLYGLNPYYADDALSDLDGDGVSNLVEYLRNTNIAFDDVAPTIDVPPDVNLVSIGAYTPVDIGLAVAADVRDGSVDAQAEAWGVYPPGRHEVVWMARDGNGNQNASSQFVNIIPLVSIVRNMDLEPDADVYIRGALNGKAPQYPVIIPLNVAAAHTDFYIADDQMYFAHEEQRSRVEARHRVSGQSDSVRIPMRMEGVAEAASGGNLEVLLQVSQSAIANHEIIIAQNHQTRSSVVQSGGPVSVSLTSDLSRALPYLFDWSGSDAAFLASGVLDQESFTFDPSLLDEGIYRVVVVIKKGSQTVEKTDLIRVIKELNLSENDDTDGDGVDDWREGGGDQNSNRVMDYLDPDPRQFLLPMSNIRGDLMQADAVHGLRLGEVAFSVGLNHPLVTAPQIQEILGIQNALPDEFVLQGFGDALFEFEITQLGSVGGQGGVVIPTRTALPSNASLFRLSALDGWRDLGSNSDNVEIASSPKIQGVCPGEQHASYTPGLTAGHGCIRLLLEDGSSADADSALDGTIRFLGGVRLKQFVQEPPPGNSGESGSSSGNPGGENGNGSSADSSGGSNEGSSGGSSGGGAPNEIFILALLIVILGGNCWVRLRGFCLRAHPLMSLCGLHTNRLGFCFFF